MAYQYQQVQVVYNNIKNMSTISSQNPTTVITIATPGPKGPPGPAAPAGDLSGSLQLTGSLSVSGSGTGSFVDFSNTQYVTGSFTGSFKGDGSGITGITASIQNSASFAVITGPNQFTGSQFVSGSIIPEAIDSGNGLHDLGSVTKPWRDLYITTSSLNFVKDAVVIASMNGEPGGVRIGNIFIGTGSISVVSGSGDNMTTVSNVVEVTTNDSGSVEKVIEQYVTASGDASITGSLTVSGSNIICLGGFFIGDGSGLTNVTADLPNGVISSSTQLNDLGYVESSITSSTIITSSANLNVITFTKGDSSTFSITVDTGSGEPLPNGVISSSAQVIESLPLGIVSGSSQLPSGIVSGSEQLPLGIISSSAQLPSGIISGSEQLPSGLISGSEQLPSGIISGSEQLPSGLISSSDQLISELPSGVVSSSAQTISNLPSDVISGSTQIDELGFINSTITSSMSVLNAETASIANSLKTGLNLEVNQITGSSASFISMSVGYLESITGSAKTIGDAFIVLNNETPTNRYAGLKVIDSGSANTTSSFEYDGLNDNWFHEKEVGGNAEYGIALFGPQYGVKDSPTYLTSGVLPKSNGNHHLVDSNITDNGNEVIISTTTIISGSLLISGSGMSGSFSGSFVGNGSGLTNLNIDPTTLPSGLVSSSAQTIANLPSGIISGSEQLPTGLISSSAQIISELPSSTISSSAQITELGYVQSSITASSLETASVNLNEITFTKGDDSTFAITIDTGSLPSGVISGSEQLPSGIISGSSQLTDLGVSVASGGSTTFDNSVIVSGSSSNLEVQGDLHVTGSLTTSVQTINPTYQPTGWTIILPVSTGNFFETTLQPTANEIIFGLGGGPGQTINLKINTNSGTPGNITWGNNIEFPDGFDSGSSAGSSQVDIFSFVTFDGLTWYGTGLKNFS